MIYRLTAGKFACPLLSFILKILSILFEFYSAAKL
jgi:hypothetical protein